MANNPRPTPILTETTRPFWDAAKHGRLMLQYDPKAGKYQFWPRPVSVHTGTDKLEWREASGKGTLFARTIVHVPARGFENVAPYVLVAVELDEGVRVVGRLIGIEPQDAKHGMRLKVCWEKLPDDGQYYAFENDE